MLEWTASPADEPKSAEISVDLPGRPAALTGHDAVRYTAPLEDPLTGDDTVAVLHLHGTYANADVEVPGRIVGGQTSPIHHDNHYDALRVPFEPEPGQLLVTCTGPDDRFGGFFDTDRAPPDTRIPAPWWAARLETHPLPFIDRLDVRPRLGNESGRLHIEAEVVTGGPLSDRLTFSLRPGDEHGGRGMMERAAVEADGAGRTTVEHELTVHDPSLWWPRERGEQHRYTLRATLGDSECSVKTGFRRVERGDDGLEVNGEPVSIRGVTLRTANPADIERAIDCNATLVRGAAQGLSPAVYEVCDAAGLLVWQDLPLTGPGEYNVERGQAFARAVGRVYGQHPSLAVAAVHDAPTAAFDDGLGAGMIDGLRRRWRAWRTGYDADPAERVATALPAAVPAVSAIGDIGTGTPARRLFPGWDYGTADDVTRLLERDSAWVVAAFGAGSLGTGDGSAGDLNRQKHDRHVDDGSEASRAYQATVVGTVAEACRLADRPAVCDALRDVASAGMGIYAVDGDEKPARAALARAYAPVQAFITAPNADESPVVVVNDLPAAFEAELSWHAGSASGELAVSVDAGERWTGGPIELPVDADSIELSLQTDAGSIENRYERV